MKTNLDRVRYNHQRMKILKALNSMAGVDREADFQELLDVCDKMGLPLVPAQLDYHLRYMRQRRWVSLRIGPNERRADAILGVTLTARGVDRIDIGKMPEPENDEAESDK